VCVPGGVFWANRLGAAVSSNASWRAFAMSPFFLDAHEVTVAELRASGVVTPIAPKRGTGDSSNCTYTDAPGAFEDLPVTCITAAVASAYCAKRGGALPSGAQYEYIRGRMSALPYVWGLDSPTCTDAVWGRVATEGFNECAAIGVGPQRAGSGMRDRVVFPTGELLDVAGNVSELISDWPPDCAKQTGVFADPVCGKTLGRAASASFAQGSSFLQAPSRDFSEAPVPTSGFRCMRPGT
jgi:formylglycine-generating enzyme required for sulfatase activity